MPTIRAFHAEDFDDLYRISLATGAAGGDASHFYADPRLWGTSIRRPMPGSNRNWRSSLKTRGGVDAGFAVGAIDTAAWEERLEREWWPALRRQYAMPSDPDASAWTPDQRRIVIIHRPT